MALSNSAVLKDGTVATTGGTSVSLLTKGTSLSQHNLMIDDGAEFQLQATTDFSVKAPKVSASAPNGYTQARTSVFLRQPLLLDNGEYTTCTGSISISVDPEMTDAEKLTMRVYLAQLLVDSDFTDFWDNQAIA